MEYHFFSDPEFAGPGNAQVAQFWDREPRQLRRNAPTQPAPLCKFTIFKATADINHEIVKLWNSCYSGTDWRFSCNPMDVERWRTQGFILAMRNEEGMLIGTFAVRRLPKGIVCGRRIQNVFVLDGLVIHPDYRNRGLASHFLSVTDREIYNTPTLANSVLLWFREHESVLTACTQAPIAILEYAYVPLEHLPYKAEPVLKAPVEMVKNLIDAIARDEQFTLVSTDIDDVDVKWFLTKSAIVGIANTHRVTTEGLGIWEVVFAANLVKPYFKNLTSAIEAAGGELGYSKGILFASNGRSRGNLKAVFAPWKMGASGFLTAHVYNWMPPEFLTGDVLFPHSCV